MYRVDGTSLRDVESKAPTPKSRLELVRAGSLTGGPGELSSSGPPSRKGWLIRSVLAVSLLLASSGCTDPSAPEAYGSSTVPLPDGRKVICVAYDSGSYAGGLSCDWERAQ